jgi:formate hydrogenlyase subunit 3/multisubunit Na+/H+ antiporter MnhD subunit
MSAPIIWVALPLLMALLLWSLQRFNRLVIGLAIGFGFFLTFLAAFLPLGETIRLGSLALRVEPGLAIAGRQLILDNPNRPLLVLFFGAMTFWFIGARAAGGHHLFVPFALGMVAMLVAAEAVQPVLYAALLLEGAVLLSLPILAPPGQLPGQGVFRYLIFQTFGMPLFILGGWALGGVQANPTDPNLIMLATVFLGFAFAFWLAVFPFYTWVPQLAGQVQPYALGFVVLILPLAVLLLMLQILGANGWLRTSADIHNVLRLSGGLMVVTAGVWAAFQRDLGRLFGFTVIMQTGYSLLALSLGTRLGNEIFVMMFIPRVVSLGLWTLSAAVLRQTAPSLQFPDLERIAERYPIASAGLVFAFLSLAGLPLLAEFPIRQVLLQEISVSHPISALGVLLGGIGLLFSGFRFLTVITGGNIGPKLLRWRELTETRAQAALILGGIVILLIVGLFPRLVFPLMVGLLQVVPNTP